MRRSSPPLRTPMTLMSSPISGCAALTSRALSLRSTASTARSSSSSGAKPTPSEVSLASGAPASRRRRKSAARSGEVGRMRGWMRTWRSGSRWRRFSRSQRRLSSTAISSTGDRHALEARGRASGEVDVDRLDDLAAAERGPRRAAAQQRLVDVVVQDSRRSARDRQRDSARLRFSASASQIVSGCPRPLRSTISNGRRPMVGSSDCSTMISSIARDLPGMLEGSEGGSSRVASVTTPRSRVHRPADHLRRSAARR